MKFFSKNIRDYVWYEIISTFILLLMVLITRHSTVFSKTGYIGYIIYALFFVIKQSIQTFIQVLPME